MYASLAIMRCGNIEPIKVVLRMLVWVAGGKLRLIEHPYLSVKLRL